MDSEEEVHTTRDDPPTVLIGNAGTVGSTTGDDIEALISQKNAVEAFTVLLKDGETTATLYPFQSPDEVPPSLLVFLMDEFNAEVKKGTTFPHNTALDLHEFKEYWFSGFVAVMVLGSEATLHRNRQWERECLGSFFVRPQFPGRSSHICTGAFLVNAGIRGKGIGKTLCEFFLEWAPLLGFSSCVFPLVYETSVEIRKILEHYEFKQAGKLKHAGILKNHDTPVDAIQYFKDLPLKTRTDDSSRFDRIKYYLLTSQYPPNSDTQEKSRLRANVHNYSIIDNKLYMKGKEVIHTKAKQWDIAMAAHRQNHGGINKVTQMLSAKYHWSKIKQTVVHVINACQDCKRNPETAVFVAQTKKRPEPTVAEHLAAYTDRPYRYLSDTKRQRTTDSQVDTALLDLEDNIMAAVEAVQKQQGSPEGQNFEYPRFPEDESETRDDMVIAARALIQAEQNDSNNLFG